MLIYNRKEVHMKKVYFAGSITGGRRDIEDYKIIIGKLKERFEVLSEFVANGELTEMGEQDKSDKEIYNKDINMIMQSDFVFAEVSQTSHGVGYELGFAEANKKPIYAVANKNKVKRTSAMIMGNPNINFMYYTNLSEVLELIDKIK